MAATAIVLCTWISSLKNKTDKNKTGIGALWTYGERGGGEAEQTWSASVISPNQLMLWLVSRDF